KKDSKILLLYLSTVLNVRRSLAHRFQVDAFNRDVLAFAIHFYTFNYLCMSWRLLASKILDLEHLRLLIHLDSDRKVVVDVSQFVPVTLRNSPKHVSHMSGRGP